jgi:hypothetical protein
MTLSVRITQIDGKLPNLALMKLAHWHRAKGDTVIVTSQIHRDLFEPDYDAVYASALFAFSADHLAVFQREWPMAIIGGTGTASNLTVESIIGGPHMGLDYSDYPKTQFSMGFSQRGCRYNCGHCCVPRKEGRNRPEDLISEIWRGDPWPRQLYLLDNDFFGNPKWRDRVEEILAGDFEVCLSQGINVRKLSEAGADALAMMKCRDAKFSTRRIYTAWDYSDDESEFFRGLGKLVKRGIRPDDIMVYMIVGYTEPGGSVENILDYVERNRKLREFGVRPFPMPFIRTRELVGFQRWIIGAYDKRRTWEEWVDANYRPENLRPTAAAHEVRA